MNVPPAEQRRYNQEIFTNLIGWLETRSETALEHYYVAAGMRRAQQGVPFSNLHWVICIAHEYLWEYMQQECLLDEPVDFWGGAGLLRSLVQFFDRASYFTLVGYEKAYEQNPLIPAQRPIA